MSTALIDQQAVIDIATMIEERGIDDARAARVRAVIPDLAHLAQVHDLRAELVEDHP